MPIKGLTDRNEGAFPQIGVIRKGAPKTQNAPGKDLAWFRVEFDEKEVKAAQVFVAAFGPTPTDITIVLPFNEIDRCWEAWRETYVAGGLVHRCDGELVQYAINPKTGERIVVNGIGNDGHPVRCRGKVDGCKPSGRLRVIVPQLQRLAYVMVLTTSILDCKNISNQLLAISMMNGGRIAGIPLVLRRRPHMISTPSGEGGKRARREKWLISIEADPEWVSAKLSEMRRLSLPGAELDTSTLLPIPKLLPMQGPEWIDGGEGDGDEEITGEFAPEEPMQAEAPTVTEQSKSPSAPESKPAVNKCTAFTTWCNTWAKKHPEYLKSDGMTANMYHVLGRVSKLGFAEVADANKGDVIASLESFAAGKVDPLHPE